MEGGRREKGIEGEKKGGMEEEREGKEGERNGRRMGREGGKEERCVVVDWEDYLDTLTVIIHH